MGVTLAMIGAGMMAAAENAPFDPRAYRDAIAGRPSEVLVLGSPHLSGLPDRFRPEHLAPLLDRLATWKPEVIAIEAVSGPQCDHLRRYSATYPGAAKDYCWDPAPAVEAVGLDAPAAAAEAERLLARWPADPDPAARRGLAALFLASGDRASALVQWLRLPAAERRAADTITPPLAAMLDGLVTRRNENYLIAAALAARLGLERVHPVDDHSADEVGGSGPDYEAAIRRIWSGPATKARLKVEARRMAGLGTPEATLALYRDYNAPAEAKVAFDGDFGAAARDATPELYGRRYLGWWETRNLRMVANMRAVLARRPGARMLTVVGASHKGYYEAYLDLMQDVRLTDATAVLR